jgi:hypothetical protein
MISVCRRRAQSKNMLALFLDQHGSCSLAILLFSVRCSTLSFVRKKWGLNDLIWRVRHSWRAWSNLLSHIGASTVVVILLRRCWRMKMSFIIIITFSRQVSSFCCRFISLSLLVKTLVFSSFPNKSGGGHRF